MFFSIKKRSTNMVFYAKFGQDLKKYNTFAGSFEYFLILK